MAANDASSTWPTSVSARVPELREREGAEGASLDQAEAGRRLGQDLAQERQRRDRRTPVAPRPLCHDPVGTSFRFKADAEHRIATFPRCPGATEAERVEGPWKI